MKKKILIVYASYGSGHKSVAEYVYEYFKEHSNDLEIKIIDIMEYGNLIAKLNVKMFNLCFKFQNSFSSTIGYELFDSKIATSPYKEIVRLLFKSDLTTDILTYKPDVLIATHFFGGIVMGKINKKYKLNTKIITIITDYASHAIWLQNHKRESAIVVSNEIVGRELLKFGVPAEKIFPFGIPLSSKFKKVDANTSKIKFKYNIKNHNLTFLFFGGGSLGSSYTYGYLKEILKLKLNINIIFVSGKNVKLQNRCNNYIKRENIKNVTVLGFTKDISNLLNIADVVITKPGGLSVTEALEMKTPMILMPGNGGQENHNAKFVTKNHFGLRVRNARQLAKTVKKLTENKKIIQEMYQNLKNYEENTSVQKLFNLVLEMENLK